MTRTTVELPDDLFREAKSRAALTGKLLREIVEEALTAYLRAAKTPNPKTRCPFPIVKGGRGGSIETMDGKLAGRLLEDEDAGRALRIARR